MVNVLSLLLVLGTIFEGKQGPPFDLPVSSCRDSVHSADRKTKNLGLIYKLARRT